MVQFFSLWCVRRTKHFFHFFSLDVPARVSEVRAKRGNLRAKLAPKNREAILRGGRARKTILARCQKQKVANFSRRLSAKNVLRAKRATPRAQRAKNFSLFQKCCELAGVYLGRTSSHFQCSKKDALCEEQKLFFLIFEIFSKYFGLRHIEDFFEKIFFRSNLFSRRFEPF